MNEEDFLLKPPTDASPDANPVTRAPTRAEAVKFALTDTPRGELDEQKAVKAEYLGNVYFDLLQKARRGIDPSKDDSMLRAEAVYFTQAMTGQDDVYGKLWKKGGFKTGREYLEKMHDFFLNGGEKNLTKELKEFQAKSYDEQVAEAMAARSELDALKHAVGYGFSYALDWLHRADTEKLGHEKELQEDIYKRQVRAEYEAKLLADNAWHELSAILPTLSGDPDPKNANFVDCVKALMESKDNSLPENMWAKFNGLEDWQKSVICRARTCLAPRVEGGFWNTLGDMAIGAANVAANIATAPYRFANKLSMVKMNDWFDAGFDVNELARRRQYLWQATGRFFAGGAEGGYLPQMQFEQICQEHGFLAESLIGAVSTLPYMAAASVSVPWLPFAGVAGVAMEAMSEMDDHVAMAGGDIADPDYMFSNALFGAMYAYTERLQVDGLLGGVKDIELRQAMLKGFWSGVKNQKAVRTLTAGTLAESLQEGLQNGIMAANEALALKEDATKAFAEGFTQDFIGSLGTMLIVEGGGMGFAHWKRSGFNNPFSAAGREAGREARSIDLETEYEKDMSLDRMVEHAARSEELRGAMDAAEAFRLFKTWESGGKDALIKAGIDPVRAEEWDYFYSSTRDGVMQDEETGEDKPDVRWQKAQQDIMQYLAHEALKRTKKGEEADLAAFDLAMQNLDWVRSAWSQGAGIRRVDEEGKVQDPGEKALEELGFSKDVAKRLSEYFHYERSAAYSPAALNGIKARYDERMAGKVTAKAALARQFGGHIVRFDGADFLQFTDKGGGINLVRIDETPGGIDFAEASEGVAVDVERATGGKVTKKQWMDATEAARRKIWKDYGLLHEGSFRQTPNVKVTIPADPSVGIDSAQAATVVGAISLDSQTDNRKISDTSAAFHEVYHAFSAFAQASGLWTKEDIAFLEKTCGKAKHTQETHDEEAGAEAFRSFLARRANGAMTVEDERSPFMKIYAAAAGLDARAKEKAAQEKVAGENEKAFFDQLIAEANKPKPKPPAPKPDLPKTAAPQRGLKPGSAEEISPPETPENKGENAQVDESAKAEPKLVQPGAPKTWSAYTPTGNVKVSGHWAVLDLKDVIHSNNPLYAVHMRAQLRNRKDNKAEEDTRKDIVNNFQGERLLDAPDTANGAPIVFYDDDGTGVKRAFVLSGNGRVLVLNELADRHLYDRYRNVMKKWAAANGIMVPSGQTPILVRVIDDYGGVTRDKVADLSNTNSIQQYTEEEQARADAEVIKALGLAKLYQANADGSPDMTPGVNDEFFSEFVRGVGDTSLYNSDRSLTQTARDRAQRALLAIAVGQGDRGRDVVKKLVEQTETLNIQRQKNAAAIMAAPVAALESNAAYAIGPDVSRAMADFMDFAEKRKTGKVGTFKDYYDQMDLIDKPSHVARELLKLLGSDKSAATIAEYVKAYCKAAAMEDPAGGLFGAARTKDEIWNDAKRLVDDTLAKQQGVEQKTQTTQPASAAAPLRRDKPALTKGSVSIAPEAAAPRPARPPAGTVTYTITPNKGGPVTATMPAGAFGDLRGPYDPYESTPESKNPIRSIFSGKAVQQFDPQGRYWGDKMPQFMGHKTEMFDRTVMTLRQKLGPEELAKFDTLVDYFGGGGSWGTSLALTTMPNVKRIIINEFDPGRAKKIELLQTLGESIATEAEKAFRESGVYEEMLDRLATAAEDGGESGSGSTMANVILRNFKDRFEKNPRAFGLMYAVTDCASRQLAATRDVKDSETGETTKVKIPAAERWRKVMEQLAEDGRNATEMRKAFEARGGKVEYVNGDSTKPDFGIGFEVPHGGNVMAVADPPYYRTEGYSDDGSKWKVGLEKAERQYAYADTSDLMKFLVDKGDGIVYTDEAWWLKKEYMEDHRVHSDGLFDDAEVLAANPEFRRENEILQGIRDEFDHFDVAGKVADRYETLGVHHGKETANAGSESRAEERQGSGVLHGGDGGSRDDDAGRQGDGRQSIRRLAGGAEGEDDAVLRAGRGSRQEGIRREDAVRRIDAALKDALPPGTKGYPGQATEIEALARHSVRQVREERIREYAEYMSANAKRWIANAARRLDERMKAAGFTEKVWHGTYGGDFNVFKFSANSHDVPAAYFTYNRGTAQNYAALRAMEYDDEAGANTRQFYVNPGKVLDLDEGESPSSLEEFIAKLQQAYEDGYNAVRVKGALDDQGIRLDENDENPEFTKEGDDDLPTDILIVMQQPGDNAAARIKAADPVTFGDDELPIPLEMRADRTMPDVRHSISRAKPMTAVEVARAVEYFGTTEDPKEAAFILQDGRWLDYEQMGEHWEISQAFNKAHMKQLDALQEFDGDAAPYIDAALKAGLVRVTGGVFDAQGNPTEAGLQVGIPLDAGLARNMIDYVDAAAERYPTLRSFTVESYAAPGFARQYDMSDPRSLAQIKRDIRDSLVRHSVTRAKNLIAVKNISAKDLLADLKRGHIVNPSLGIIAPGTEFSEYGSITLVFDEAALADDTPIWEGDGGTIVNEQGEVESDLEIEDPNREYPGTWRLSRKDLDAQSGFVEEATRRDRLQQLVGRNEDEVKATFGFPYYEAKKAGSLPTNLIKAAVVPQDTSKEVLDALSAAGIETIRYNGRDVTFDGENGTYYGENAADRAAKVAEFANNAQNIRFSILSSGRYYGTELRDIAHGLKRGDKDSIDQAAELMALNVPEKAVLVPMPGHEGPATTMLPLAEAIAKRVKGATVVDALVAEPHESNYTHKQRVHHPVKVTMHSTGAKIPKGRPVLVVDNVIASGATYRAAQAVIPNADLLTLADAGRGRETPGHREQMRHSVFMGAKGAIWSNTGKERLYLAEEMYVNAGKKYTPKLRDAIYAKTGWWLGTDGQWRIEIPDLKPKKLAALPTGIFRDGMDAHVVPLTDLVSHTRLFKAYSELKHLDVWFIDPDSDQLTGLAGWLEDGKIIMSWDALTNLDPEDGEIKLTDDGLRTLTHEVQHFVQWMEGFASDGSQSVNGKKNYWKLAGEVEARNAERRMFGPWGTLTSTRYQNEQNWTEMLENNRAPWQTQDIPTLDQLLSNGDGTQTDVRGNPVARHSISTTADIEADARRAITASVADGDKNAAQDALENYVAYFKLAHGSIPRPQTLARIGLSLGMNVVNPKRILKNAEKLAEQMKGTVVESASQNGDVATAMSLIKREKDIGKKVENLIAGGVELGGKLTHKGVGKINSLLQKRVESMMRDFTAASLADMEGDTGIDIAAEIIENNPDAFETEYRRAKKAAGEGEEAQDEGKDESGQGGVAAVPFDESEMSDAERYKREILLKEQAERVAKFIEAAKRRAEENGAKAAEARERRRVVELEGGGEEGGGNGGEAAQPDEKWDPKPKDVKANFKTPEEFAAFLRVWARDKFAKTHGLTTLGKVEQDRLFAEFYRICVRKELQDLADKLLAPKMTNDKGELVTNQRLAKIGNGARVWVNRRLQDLEKGMRPDTIERASADIFAFINKAAIRVSRVDLITTFKQELKERFLEGAEFDEFKQDTERKLTGWLEEATRYIIRVCDLSRKSVNGDPSQLEQEYRALHDILDKREKVYDESGRDVADAAKEDAETRKAQWKLALLDKYGAMRSLMPGQILDLQNAAFDYLENEAKKLEDSWKETREEQDRVRRDFAGAIVGPGGQRYDEKKHTILGWISNKFFDSLNGMIRLRLEHLTRFAGADERAKAKDAINSILVMLGDGEVAYARALQADREAFFTGLGEMFKREDGRPDNAAIKKYLERMDEPIPVELSRQLSNQGYAESMTFGQMLQLLVSLEQRSFKDTIEENGREGQAELIRTFRYRDADGNAVNAFTKEDDAFVDMLRAFYAAKRDQISEVTERMVGQKVDSPDPLYCPIRRWMGDKARDLHADPTQRWDPISKIFSRRVPSTRDFDESRTIVGLFFENSKESAKLTAWAERGSFIRNVVTSAAFQSRVRTAFGPGELAKILKQLEATFNGGEQRSQTPGEVAAADKAVNFVTYAYLGFNPLSALKQTTSFAVWANQLPNGFADLWRYMTHFDTKALKHLMESDEYKVRYGNAVGSGMDYATKGINMNPGQNPVSRALSGAGMWMLKRGDFVPGGWIAQGVYKDLLDKHLKEGMAFEEADRLAITETFNMLEETQQSGRTYNTNMLQIEHGRIGRLLTQFATSPLQQLQYETQAWREWRDMVRYQMGDKRIAEARAKFRRAVVINHVIIPAALNLVIAMYKAALGEEPPWEKDGYHWTLLIDMLLGQFSRVFFLGSLSTTTLNALLKRESPRLGQMLPIEGVQGMAASGAFLLHDLATMNVDNLQKDLERAMKSTAPTRIPYSIYRRITGDSDADRKAKKEAQKHK